MPGSGKLEHYPPPRKGLQEPPAGLRACQTTWGIGVRPITAMAVANGDWAGLAVPTRGMASNQLTLRANQAFVECRI